MKKMNLKYSYICLLAIHFLFPSCSKENREHVDAYTKMQMEAVNLIAQPAFSGDYMLYKLTSGKAVLERYYVDTKQLYFTCDSADFNDENLYKFVINRDSVTRAKEENGILVLDDKRYDDPSRAFFKMPVSNFKVDTNKIIETKYANGVSYKVTLPQILNYTYLRSTLGGGAIAITEDNSHFMNHGSVVAKQNEPSLKALVEQLTEGLSTNEEKAQKLLDFVTQQIEYNTQEAENGYETIKRPDEVLFTKNSDCSGKAILFASLLQQIHMKWCLFYFEGHVCVGVPGKFNTSSPLKFKLKNTEYYLAEITDPKGVIGQDSWNGEMNTNNLKYYQISDSGSDVFSYKTNMPLKFVTGKLNTEQ